MKSQSQFRILKSSLTASAFVPTLLMIALADESKKNDDVAKEVVESVEIEIEPGGFLIESDGEVVEFQAGSGKRKMSVNFNELLGKDAGGLGEMISKLVQEHPEQASKLAQSFLGGNLMDIVQHESESFPEMFAAGIEAAPFYIGVEVEVPDDVLLSQLNLKKGTALVVKQVVENSPAAAAGIQQHDVLTSRDGAELKGREDLVVLVLAAGRAEKPVELVMIRKAQAKDISIAPANRETNAFGTTFFGEEILIQNTSAQSQSELKAVREELSEQRKMLESILSRLPDGE
ncbi:MAG: hypothetical protein ACI9R3_006277 [Verrucomicrobiales bacterium]|jgi:hypothetical protein